MLNNILCNENAWTIPEPPPEPTPRKRGILFLSPKDMQEAKKSMREKGIKPEDVKNLPPIEEIHGLDNPIQAVEVNYVRRFDESDIPFDKSVSLCMDEFDNFVAKQQSFNDYVSRQLEQNARMLSHLSACVDRNVNDLKLLSKHASMVTTQVEQVLKAQNDLLNELNDNSIRVVTRGGRMTQEPLYPEGHPERIEQDSQGVSTDAPSHPRNKKKDDRNLHASNPVAATPESPNDVSVSDAETQSGDEHEPNDNINGDVHDDAQPSNEKDVEIEPDLDNPQPKNRRYDKNDFAARKHAIAGGSTSKKSSSHKASSHGAWLGSDIGEEQIEVLRHHRLLPRASQVLVRLPDAETAPTPAVGEIVVFNEHFYRGFGLPTSALFSECLRFFGLQPHHLAPNAILQLSAFVILCEGFVGIEPRVDLWHNLFFFKHQSIAMEKSEVEKLTGPRPMTPCRAACYGNKSPSMALRNSSCYFSGLRRFFPLKRKG
ncbi:hypothetical protein ZWY2020_042539 [Hordeum vulgare]|nr:hypothetical protein ZWY2020_042539 [Hordeum vulgare]